MSDYTVSIDLTPEQLANAFWAMGSDEQADFFSALDSVAGHRLCIQMAGVVRELSERADAGDRSGQNGFQTMLSHAQEYVEAAADIRTWRAQREITRMAERASGATP